MVGPLMTAIKVRESKENLGAAGESVNSWASGNNRLPQWGDGTVDATNDEFVEVTRSTADAWGRPFIYLYDANLFNATPTKDTICGRRTTTITLTDSNTSATIPNVAYVILSAGDDAVANTTLYGTVTNSSGATVYANSVINKSGALTPTAPATSASIAANTTDDLVRWVTLDELRTKVGCQGAQLKIVNNELPYGYENSPYLVKLYRDGGGGTYSWCWTGTLPGGVKQYDKETATQTEITVSAACSLTAGTWIAENGTERPVIQGIPTATPQTRGTYNQFLYVKDTQGNITYKPFVLTINPQQP